MAGSRLRTILVAAAVSCTAILLLCGAAPQKQAAIFTTSDNCFACHTSLTNAAGENVSISAAWRGTMMANAALDAYWRAAVTRETIDHPAAKAEIEHECATCHMPMARYERNAAGGREAIFAHYAQKVPTRANFLALDGVSCATCHQIAPDGLGERNSFSGRFAVDGAAQASYGRFDVDPGRTRVMQSASALKPTRGAHLSGSELCGSCHTLHTHAIDAGPEAAAFPEQTPYLEWKHSGYAKTTTCQECHMPAATVAGPVSSVLSQVREGVGSHDFRGANFVMPRILAANAVELQVAALPAELEDGAVQGERFLREKSGAIDITGASLRDGAAVVEVAIRNDAGHKLPSGYPSRRAWIHLQLLDSTGAVVFESGKLRPDGSIEGNDADADPLKYEPHYAVIADAGEVQIYEPVLVDRRGAVTTGLLEAVRYVKDNRLLPAGFDKATADAEVGVYGEALKDDDFVGGGDRLRYQLRLGDSKPPYTVRAELLYQPIAYRWAQNLAQTEHVETGRFIRAYNAVAPRSAAVIATAEAEVR